MRLRGKITNPLTTTTAMGIVCAGIGACGGGGGTGDPNVMSSTPPAAQGTTGAFTDTALVVDKQEVVPGKAVVDAHLQNPWGIAVAKGQPFWIADNNSNVSTLYTGSGEIETQAVTGSANAEVTIPPSAAGVPANPTGQVFNGGGGFSIATVKGQSTCSTRLSRSPRPCRASSWIPRFPPDSSPSASRLSAASFT